VVSFTPWPLYSQGKIPWYQLGRRLVGPRAIVDTVSKRKVPSPPPHELNPDHLTVQSILATMLTEPSWEF